MAGTGYFAQVEADGLVTDLRRVSSERIAANPDLYPGIWIEVPDMAQYPAAGWVWADGVFTPPPASERPVLNWDDTA
jgi:hypothetical protein